MANVRLSATAEKSEAKGKVTFVNQVKLLIRPDDKHREPLRWTIPSRMAGPGSE